MFEDGVARVPGLNSTLSAAMHWLAEALFLPVAERFRLANHPLDTLPSTAPCCFRYAYVGGTRCSHIRCRPAIACQQGKLTKASDGSRCANFASFSTVAHLHFSRPLAPLLNPSPPETPPPLHRTRACQINKAVPPVSMVHAARTRPPAINHHERQNHKRHAENHCPWQRQPSKNQRSMTRSHRSRHPRMRPKTTLRVSKPSGL